MHVLHLETGRHLYGGALQVLYLMDGLKDHGCQSTLVCPVGSAISQAATKAAQAIHEVPMAGELDPRLVLRLLRIIGKARPNIVHVHSRRGADLWGGMAAQATRTKAILTRRVDNPERHWIVAAKCRLYERVITISEAIREIMLAEGVPPAKVVCVRSALDTQRYERPCERTWFLREFNLEKPQRPVGIVAQLIPRKGHQFLIEAAPAILKGFPDARFLFFGQGPLEGALKDLCRRRGLESHVRFAGFRRDLERILPCLELLVHPATMEGLGLSLLQAAAAGVPIVASRVGGIPEIVDDGVNGYLFDVGDTDAFIDRVLTLLGKPSQAADYGRNGQRKVLSEFAVEKMVAGNLAVYDQVLAASGQRV